MIRNAVLWFVLLTIVGIFNIINHKMTNHSVTADTLFLVGLHQSEQSADERQRKTQFKACVGFLKKMYFL